MLSLDSKWCWFGEKVIVLGEHFCHQSFYKVRNMTDKQYRRKSYTELEKRSIQHTHKMIQKKHRKITDSMLISSSSIENLSLKTVNDFFSRKFKHTTKSRLRLSFVILTVRYLTRFFTLLFSHNQTICVKICRSILKKLRHFLYPLDESCFSLAKLFKSTYHIPPDLFSPLQIKETLPNKFKVIVTYNWYMSEKWRVKIAQHSYLFLG